MAFTGPHGYVASYLGDSLPVTDPAAVYYPPLVPSDYTSGALPTSAWNVSMTGVTWADWSLSSVSDNDPQWIYSSTAGSSLTYSFLGVSLDLQGTFSGESTNTANGTLQVTVDGYVVPASGTFPNATAAPGPHLEGFGYDYGASNQFPGNLGGLYDLDYDWHTIEVKLIQGWMNISQIQPSFLQGSEYSTTNLTQTGFITNAPNGPAVNEGLVTAGVWDVVDIAPVGGSAYPVVMTNRTGSAVTFSIHANTTYWNVFGYRGPDSGDYSVTLTDVSTWPKSSPGTISWYGVADNGVPTTYNVTGKTQWPMTSTNLWGSSLDQSRLYNATLTFLGSDGERIGLISTGYILQGPVHSPHHTNVGAIVGGAVAGGVVLLVLLALGFWWWRRSKKRQSRNGQEDLPPAYKAETGDDEGFEMNNFTPTTPTDSAPPPPATSSPTSPTSPTSSKAHHEFPPDYKVKTIIATGNEATSST